MDITEARKWAFEQVRSHVDHSADPIEDQIKEAGKLYRWLLNGEANRDAPQLPGFPKLGTAFANSSDQRSA